MKRCALCGCAARMHCESDRASLCWGCDEIVHGANFLVAKHYRSLLCQVCQCPTPWTASGPKLGPTVSICQSCFSVYNKRREESGSEDRESRGENSDDCEDDDESLYEESDDGYGSGDGYSDGNDEGEEEEEEEEDGENQVVPWSGSAASPAPPVASSSSSDEEVSSGSAGAGGVSKRLRDCSTDHDSEDEIRCPSPHMSYASSVSNGVRSLDTQRPLKQPRTGEAEDGGQDESRSTAIVDSLRRLQRDVVVGDEENASSTILGLCRLSRDHHRSR